MKNVTTLNHPAIKFDCIPLNSRFLLGPFFHQVCGRNQNRGDSLRNHKSLSSNQVSPEKTSNVSQLQFSNEPKASSFSAPCQRLMSTAYGAWTGRLDNRQLSKEIGKLEHPGSGLGCDYLRGMIYGSLQGTNFINKAVGKAELRAMTKTDSRFKFDHDWTHYPGHRKLYYHTMKTTVFVVFLNSINPSYSTLILTIILFYLQIIITMTKP